MIRFSLLGFFAVLLLTSTAQSADVPFKPIYSDQEIHDLITEKIHDIYDGEVDIKVNVSDSRVTLKGELQNGAQKSVLDSIITMIGGVRSLDNKTHISGLRE